MAKNRGEIVQESHRSLCRTLKRRAGERGNPSRMAPFEAKVMLYSHRKKNTGVVTREHMFGGLHVKKPLKTVARRKSKRMSVKGMLIKRKIELRIASQLRCKMLGKRVVTQLNRKLYRLPKPHEELRRFQGSSGWIAEGSELPSPETTSPYMPPISRNYLRPQINLHSKHHLRSKLSSFSNLSVLGPENEARKWKVITRDGVQTIATESYTSSPDSMLSSKDYEEQQRQQEHLEPPHYRSVNVYHLNPQGLNRPLRKSTPIELLLQKSKEKDPIYFEIPTSTATTRHLAPRKRKNIQISGYQDVQDCMFETSMMNSEKALSNSLHRMDEARSMVEDARLSRHATLKVSYRNLHLPAFQGELSLNQIDTICGQRLRRRIQFSGEGDEENQSDRFKPES